MTSSPQPSDALPAVEKAIRAYLQAVNKLANLMDRVADQQQRLRQTVSRRDAALLTAATRWSSLNVDEKEQLKHMVMLFEDTAAAELVRSMLVNDRQIGSGSESGDHGDEG